MRGSHRLFRTALACAAVAALTGLVLAGCGGGDGGSAEPTKVAMTITEAGKGYGIQAPGSFTGGLVELTVRNEGERTVGQRRRVCHHQDRHRR